MNEDFLHYVWKFQKYATQDLTTTASEKLQIVKTGFHNENAGPDFTIGKVVVDGQLWVGNIEIHVNSSHWFLHHHETDLAYNNVILHVVWEHDMEIRRTDETVIPTLELKGRIDTQTMFNYRKLFSVTHKHINCESDFESIHSFVMSNWVERLFVERLEEKSALLFETLSLTKNNWEASLFVLLCKNFGLKVNGDSFLSLAQSIPYKVIKKMSASTTDLESLFLGQAGMLNVEVVGDGFYNDLQKRYRYVENKFKLTNAGVIPPKFFRLRPASFPTIRLSQLAVLIASEPHLFSKIINASKVETFYQIFDVVASDYWSKHYNFHIASTQRPKKLTKRFIDLIIVNTVIPIKHAYAKHQGVHISEELIQLTQQIKGEKNSVISMYKELRDFRDNALVSQSLLQLHSKYCSANQCLKCAIGNEILTRRA